MDDIDFTIIAAPLPADSRYRFLLRRVLDSLPPGWDEFRTVGVELEPGKPSRGYASAYRIEEIETDEEDEHLREQTWIVTLYPEWLDQFSDDAVAWAIAHEFGHVVSGCRCGIVIEGHPMTRVSGDIYREIEEAEAALNEQKADELARSWGFTHEEQIFLAEAGRL